MKKTSEDSLKKFFFPKFKLLNSGCGLSVGAAYLRVRLICGCLRLTLFSGSHLAPKYFKVVANS